MKIEMRCCCLTAAALFAILQTASAADVTGKITLKGTPPPEAAIPFDPICGKFHATKETSHLYLVGSGGELGDVFVYIKEGAKPTPPPAEPMELDQVGCIYTPYIFGVHTKQKVTVKNSDPTLHNVHIIASSNLFSGLPELNRAEVQGQTMTVSFDNPEILVHFKCDVHIWMHSYAGVLDHPYYSVSAKDGTYKIANLPAGKYVLEAYHRKAGRQTKEITVGDQNQTADFTFEVPAK
jgi:hypothetical protein